MALHLQKLCVGAESVEDHRKWIEWRLEQARRAGKPVEQIHTTRSMPKRRDELLAGGSLYWVTKGLMQSRQRIVDLRSIEDKDGITRCEIVLDPTLILTKMQPRRPFQGWRYLPGEDAPGDLSDSAADDILEMPLEMRKELAGLGLL